MTKVASNIWIDASGKTRQTIVNTATGEASILSQLEALTNAGLVEWWEASATVPAQVGLSAPYPSVRDFVKLIYETPSGEEASITLVAPISSIFLADGMTVDPSAVSTLTTACIGNLQAPSGEVVSAFVAGLRVNGNNSEYLVGGGNVGTVTSVGLTVPGPLQVTGSPVTSSGTLAVSWPNTVADGQLLIGKGSDHSMHLATLVAGSHVTITDGPGTITISATSGSSGLATVVDQRVANGNVTPANTFVTLNTVSLSTGTWLLWGQVDLQETSTGEHCTIRLTDGTAIISQYEIELYTSGFVFSGMCVGLYIVAAGPTNVFLQAASGNGNAVALADPVYNGGGSVRHTTQLIALNIA